MRSAQESMRVCQRKVDAVQRGEKYAVCVVCSARVRLYRWHLWNLSVKHRTFLNSGRAELRRPAGATNGGGGISNLMAVMCNPQLFTYCDPGLGTRR